MGVVSTGALVSVLTSLSTLNILGLASSIFSMTGPTLSNLLIVTPDDKVKSAFNKNYMKKLFSKQPQILNAYQQEKDSLTINKIRGFLYQFNELTK